MNANKLRTRFLLTALLAALLLTSACTQYGAYRTVDGKLVVLGHTYMYSLKDGNLGEALDLMSSQVKRPLKDMVNLASNFVDVESIVKDNVTIASWTFDGARITARLGSPKAVLEGKVVYSDGTGGKLRLEYVQEDGVWKVRSSSMEK
jgi:hypothetical protein